MGISDRATLLVFGVTTFALVPLAPRAAFAQDAAIRRDLLDNAQRASASGDHAQALDLATRAGQIQMTPSLRLFIAQEQQTLGHIAEALDSAELCIRETERDVTARSRDQILAACHELETVLRARVGRVTAHLPSPVPEGMHLSIAGHDVPPAVFGYPFIVTPGDGVTVDATAPGRAPFHQRVNVAAGATVDVSVAFGAATTATNAAPTEHPATSGSGATAATNRPAVPDHATPSDTGSTGPGIGPIVVMGLGVVGLGLGATFFALRSNVASQLDMMCSSGSPAQCPTTASGLVSNVGLYGTLTYVGFGVGAAALIGGAAWLLLAPRAARSHAWLEVTPTFAGVHVGIGVTL